MTKRALILRSGFDPRPEDPGPNNVACMRALLHQLHFEITVCEGDEATRDGILAAFTRLITDARHDDAVVIYYTGHGYLVSNPDFTPSGDLPRLIQLICPSDYGESNETSFRGITSLELSRRLLELSEQTHNVTAIWDCCFSAQLGGGGVFRATAKSSVWPTLDYDTLVDNFKLAQITAPPPSAAGNPHVVRIAATSRHDLSYSVEMPPSERLAPLRIEAARPHGRVGALTYALVNLLLPIGDRRVSWRQLLPTLRSHLHVQHPEIEGQTARVPFSLDVVDHVGIAVTARGERATLGAGQLLGVAVGDVYAALPAHARRIDDGELLARLIVDEVAVGDSQARIEWTTAVRALPPGCVAIAIERELARLPVRVVAPPRIQPALDARITASPLLRVAADGEAGVVAELRCDEATIVLNDEVGPLSRPVPYPAGLAGPLQDAENLAAEHRLRAMFGGLDTSALTIELGIAGPHGFTGVAEHGAAFALGERVAVRIDNRGDQLRYVHVFDIGLRRRIARLNAEANGIALAPGAQALIGETLDSGRLVGFELLWPLGLPRDRPRTESFLIVVTDAPADLRVLESPEPSRDVARTSRGTPSPLQALFADVRGHALHGDIPRSGARSGTRSVTRSSTPGQFALVWRTFSVLPVQ